MFGRTGDGVPQGVVVAATARMSVAFAVALYAMPLFLAPLPKARPRDVVVVALSASFIGEVTYLVYMGDRRLTDVLGFYPMAVFPLGLWAGVLGGAGIRALERAVWWPRKVPLVVLGVLGGGLVGVASMELYVLGVSVALQEGAQGVPLLFAQSTPLLFSGLAAGAFSGVLCSHFALAGRMSASASPSRGAA